ncbi:MAG: hypothetical protein WB689_18160 [Xanthobacteraceae bacterium]
MRCSDEIGVAGRLGGGLIASEARARTGLGLPVVAGGLFLAVGRRAGFFASFFRIVPVFPCVALLTVRFLRLALALVLPLALALPLTFFFVAIAAS